MVGFVGLFLKAKFKESNQCVFPRFLSHFTVGDTAKRVQSVGLVPCLRDLNKRICLWDDDNGINDDEAEWKANLFLSSSSRRAQENENVFEGNNSCYDACGERLCTVYD